jgi:putative membrane protein
MYILINWFISAVAIMAAAYLLPKGVTLQGFVPALVVAVVLGFINSVIRPILILLTLPLNILTLGLFTLVINAFMIMLTSGLVPGFKVHGFWWAMLFSLILFAINAILRKFKNTPYVQQ